MSFINTIQDLERLDQLIRLKSTGSPDELANKMNISKRTVFNLINRLKELGCPIYFNCSINSYCYLNQGKLNFRFNSLDNEGLNKISGGVQFFSIMQKYFI